MQGFKEYSQEFDAELALVELTLEEVQQLDEVLDTRARMKRAQQFRRSKAKISMGRKRAAMRMANTDTIKRRAIARAKSKIIARMTQGRGKGSLSYGARQNIDKRLARMKGGIQRLATKLIKQVRADDRNRHSSKSAQPKTSNRLIKRV